MSLRGGHHHNLRLHFFLAINRMLMAWSTLGALPSTPLGALINESALTPAECLLNYRQTRFAQRVLSAPEGSGTEDILRRRGTAMTNGDPPWGGRRRLRSGTWGRKKEVSGSGCHHGGEGSKRGGRDGESSGPEWAERRTRPGRTDLGWRIKKWYAQWCGRKKQGTAEHHKPSKKDRQEHGPDGKEKVDGGRHPATHTKVTEERAVHGTRLWKQGHTILSEAQYNQWAVEGYHLGTTEEVSDAELYAITEQLWFGMRREHQEYTIFVDSQAAIKGV